ncbi:hypothetical protein JIY74_38380, partial [Vibrio harveyi]|nr:hypothetical protein [Vibrio harveyi]
MFAKRSLFIALSPITIPFVIPVFSKKSGKLVTSTQFPGYGREQITSFVDTLKATIMDMFLLFLIFDLKEKS